MYFHTLPDQENLLSTGKKSESNINYEGVIKYNRTATGQRTRAFYKTQAKGLLESLVRFLMNKTIKSY